MTAAIQTLWSELIVASLADAGVATCVISPGSRSTPIALALAAHGRFDLPSIIDERAAAFFALGVARATGKPAAMLCTSGTAAAHYLPAIIEASLAGVPLIAITADRPPELQHCGASQTIDQVKLYGDFVRGAFDFGAPVGSTVAMRAVRRKCIEAVTLAQGPHPGPVHLEVPLRKPLEPAVPSTDEERALARVVGELRRMPMISGAPRLVADRASLDALAAAIAAEPRGIIVAGAMPLHFAAARDAVFALAARAGYPILAESGSQVRSGHPLAEARGQLRSGHPLTQRAALQASAQLPVSIDHFDLVLAAPSLPGALAPRLIIQIGSEPVSAAWSGARATHLAGAACWALADYEWRDPDSSARAVIIGDVAISIEYLVEHVEVRANDFATAWQVAEHRVTSAIDRALVMHPHSEGAVVRAAIDATPANAILQIGNSLPIRVVDLVSSGRAHRVITQRGAAGIDGLIASAAGATRTGAPVLLILGDVSFAHDLGGLLAAREVSAPLAIVVVDNGGGRIFGGLPIAKTGDAATFERHFVTAPAIDPAAVANVLGVRAVTAASSQAVASAVAAALAMPGATVIHAPVTASGAQDVRRDALELLDTQSSMRPRVAVGGESHV